MENELGKTGRLAAIYATLAMAPATIVLFFADYFMEVSVILGLAFVLQAVFAKLWAARIQEIRAIIDCAQFSWSSNFMAIAVRCSAFLLFGLGVYFLLIGGDEYSSVNYYVFLGVIFYSLQIPLIISSIVMKVVGNGFVVAAIGYNIIFISSFALFGNPYKIPEFYRAMTFIGVSVAIVGWSLAASQLSKLKSPDIGGEDEEEVADSTSEMPEASPEIPFEMKQQLMAYLDEQLSYIVESDNPYVSQMQRKTAKEIIEKRRLWEQMKELTDAELMDIVGNVRNSGDYIKADVASMELYSRRSPMIVSAVSSLSPEQIDDILANPGKYFDGYIMMARELAENK